MSRGYRVVGNSRNVISKSKELKASEDLVLVDGDIGRKDTAIKSGRCRDYQAFLLGIDLLVNNAGIYLPKPFTEYTPEDFAMMIGNERGRILFHNPAGSDANAQAKSPVKVVVSISTVLTDQPLAGAPISCPSSPSPDDSGVQAAPWRWNTWPTRIFDSILSLPVLSTRRMHAR